MFRKFMHNLLFFIPLLLPFISKAFDSLKIKKSECFEEGKLVRATFWNKQGNKVKEYFNDYNETFDENFKNEVLVFNFKSEEYQSIANYYIRKVGRNIVFYKSPFVGSIQSVKKDSLGRSIEANCTTLLIDISYDKQIFSLDSLDLIPFRKEPCFFKKYYYDKLGNLIEEKYIDKSNFGKNITFQYDSLNRQKGFTKIEKPYKIKGEITYQGNIIETICETLEGKKLKEKTIEKWIENSEKQELRKELYQIPLKKSKPIGEPKLTFTQENIYENDRIVKIIYIDHILNKTKIHELKYEFYD